MLGTNHLRINMMVILFAYNLTQALWWSDTNKLKLKFDTKNLSDVC